ncbi:NB-ARC domains-containing protein [Tanacetum coccineum]
MAIKKLMSSKPILLVLDDVDHRVQLKALAGSASWFLPRKFDYIHSSYAFEDKHLSIGFQELAEKTINYDGLNLQQQNILLDITCLFLGENNDFVASILDGCNFFADTNMRVLVDKSLIMIFSNMSLQMHDLIQAIARAIVREESIMHGKQRRLLISPNVYDTPGQNKVAISEAIEVLVLSLEKFSQKVHLDANDFAHMKRLQILKIYQEEKVYEQKLELKGHNVIFSGNVSYLSNELSLFYWHGCPFNLQISIQKTLWPLTGLTAK